MRTCSRNPGVFCPMADCPGVANEAVCRYVLIQRVAAGELVQAPPAAEILSCSGKVRVGLVAPGLHVGGSEMWQLALARHADQSKIQWVGCAVIGQNADIDPTMHKTTSALMPVLIGQGSLPSLASQCDVLVSWSVDGMEELGRMPNRPALVFVSHFPVDSGGWGNGVANMLAGVDRWVAVSQLSAESIRGRVTAPITIIMNAVDPERLQPTKSRAETLAAWSLPTNAKVAGYLGRLSPEKDPLAMARLAESLPANWYAVVVGDGGLRNQLGLHPQLRVVGTMNAGDALGAFDVLVSPSRYESFGLSIAEAIFLNKPLVSTSAGLVKMVPGLAEPIPIGADGSTLATAVLWAHASGPTPAAQAFKPKLGPERFGREWTDLLIAMAPGTPAIASYTPTKMVSTFLGVMAGTASRAMTGRSIHAPLEVVAEREAACLACVPHYDATVDACRHCHCGQSEAARVLGVDLKLKRSLAASACPVGKWFAVF